MPLEVIQRSIGLLIGGFLPTDKQVNHILTPYVTYSYAHRLGSSIHDGVCKLSLKACTLWMEPAERNLYTTHKAGRAALGLSCGACFEQPNSVYFGCGAALQVLHNRLLLNKLRKMPAAQIQQAFYINH